MNSGICFTDYHARIVKRIRTVLDSVMMILSLVLMGGNQLFTADIAHEVCGVLTFILWIMHVTLNRRWYASLWKSMTGMTRTDFSVVRLMQIIINTCIVVCAVFLMISALVISNHVFVFLHIGSGAWSARAAHLVASPWYFVFMSRHVGMHAGMMANAVHCRRSAKKSNTAERCSVRQKTRIIFSRAVTAAACVYGVYAFIVRGIGKYLLYRQPFFFFDLSRGYILFIIDYTCMMILMATISYLIAKASRMKITCMQNK